MPMPLPERPRNPEELARAIVRMVGPGRVERVIGLTPVSPPEGHAFYAFVVLRGDAPDARTIEAKLHRHFTPRRPRVDYWVMGTDEWERSSGRAGHPARSALLDGTVLYGEVKGATGASVA